MTAVMRSDIGKIRLQNEDAVWLDEDKGIFIVADGMGGHLAGEVASSIAVETIREMIQKEVTPNISILCEAAQEANKRIIEHTQKNAECIGMGTTLTCLWYAGRYVYIVHVGDSRIYRFRNGHLIQITQDHSLVAELVRKGLLTDEEARYHPRKNVITRALGTVAEMEPDVLAAQCLNNDLWLICTDGLSGMIDDTDIERILKLNQPLEQSADILLKKALENGGIDNITFILWRKEE